MAKSIKKNYVFNLIYQLTLIIVPLIVTPYVSRILLADGIGQYSFSFSLICYFTLFASLGFEYYAQREIAKAQDNKAKQSQAFWEIVVCRGYFVAISLLVNLLLIAFGVYGKYTTLMKILSINIIAVGFDIAFFFQGNENFAQVAIRNMIIKLTGMVLIFVLVKKANNLWIYTLINAGMLFVGSISLWPMLSKNLVKFDSTKFAPFSHLLGTLRLFLPTLAITLYTVLDKSLIGFITKSDAENGVYEQSEKIVKMAMTLITCLGAVMAVRNTHELEIGNKQKVEDNIYKSANFLWVLGLPMMFGIILISENLVPWFLGDTFSKATYLLMSFSPLIFVIGMSCLLGIQYLIPSKNDRKYTISIISGAVVNLVLNVPLIYFLGALGATIATVVAEIVVSVMMLIFVRKELSIKKIFVSSIKPLIASTIMFGAVYPWARLLSPSILHTFIIFFAAVAIYVIAVLALREPFVWHYATHFAGKFFKKKKAVKPAQIEESQNKVDSPRAIENETQNEAEQETKPEQRDEQK